MESTELESAAHLPSAPVSVLSALDVAQGERAQVKERRASSGRAQVGDHEVELNSERLCVVGGERVVASHSIGVGFEVVEHWFTLQGQW